MDGSFIISDYEKALRVAINDVIADCRQFNCWFHFKQANRRYAQNHCVGLLKLISKKHSKWFKALMSLPLLPPEAIEPQANRLLSDELALKKQCIVKFCKYYRSHWIDREGPSNISVFNEDIRTTAGLEAYNGVLSKNMKHKASFYVFVRKLQEEEVFRTIEFRNLISSGSQLPAKAGYFEVTA